MEEKNAEQAFAAETAFNAGDYAAALSALQSLAPEDPKVQQNVLVAQHYARGCTDPELVLAGLQGIRRAVAGRSADGDDGPLKEETDVAAHTSYNEAVVLFQTKQFKTALHLLEGLYLRIEPIEEQLAVRVCFLLLDSYLALGLTEKAAGVLLYLDKALAVEQEKAAANAGEGGAAAPEPAAGLLQRALMMEPTTSSSSAEPLYALTPEAFGLLLHYYKAKQHLLNKSMKSSKREIKCALAASQTSAAGAASPALYLKSNLEYLRANYRKSIKLLHESWQGGADGEGHTALYFNNLGCVHARMGKNRAASFYFLRSLRENNAACVAGGPDGKVSLPAYSRNRRSEIQYNLGLQLLLIGQPRDAFSCFQEAALMYYDSPRLWLRMAECCVAEHVRLLEQPDASKSDLVSEVVGEGDSRRLVLPTRGIGSAGDAPAASGLRPDDSGAQHTVLPAASAAPKPRGDARFGAMSLEYAVKSSRNCLLLLRGAAARAGAAAQADASGAPAPPPGVESEGAANTSADEERAKETAVVMQSALLALSYASLCLDNPVVARNAALEALELGSLSAANSFLAHAYAAESECLLRRPEEAEKHLSPSLLRSDEPAEDETSSEGHRPLVFDGHCVSSSSKSMLYVNLSISLIAQRKTAQAQSMLQKALEIDANSAPALLTKAYLELRSGHTEACLRLLKLRRTGS